MITTLSCGNGTRPDHAFADQLPPAVPLHVCVAGESKVIPELPPQSPIDVPVHVAAPLPVISIKSTLLRVVFAAAIARGLPSVFDCTSRRFKTLLPVSVTVPVTIRLPLRLTVILSVLVAVPIRTRLIQVIAVLVVRLPVSVTVPSVTPGVILPPSMMFELAIDEVMLALLTFHEVPPASAPFSVMLELPNVIARVLPDVDTK